MSVIVGDTPLSTKIFFKKNIATMLCSLKRLYNNREMNEAVRGEGRITVEEAIGYTEGLLRVGLDNLPPELIQLTRAEIEAQRPPSEVDILIQRNFWAVVEKAKKEGATSVKQTHIFAGACSEMAFQRFIKNPIRLAYMLHNPIDDIDRMKNMLVNGLARMENELLKMPITEKSAGHFIKALELLINRVHGPMVQRIEAKHAHMKVPPPPQPDNLKDVNQRLEELKSKLIAAPQKPDIITQVQQSKQQEYDTIEVTHESNSG